MFAEFHFLRPWWLALLPVGVWLITEPRATVELLAVVTVDVKPDAVIAACAEVCVDPTTEGTTVPSETVRATSMVLSSRNRINSASSWDHNPTRCGGQADRGLAELTAKSGRRVSCLLKSPDERERNTPLPLGEEAGAAGR